MVTEKPFIPRQRILSHFSFLASFFVYNIATKPKGGGCDGSFTKLSRSLAGKYREKTLAQHQRVYKNRSEPKHGFGGRYRMVRPTGDAVRSKPPNRYVRCLQIYEDEQGRIKKVDYDYFEPTEAEIGDTIL